MDFIHAKELLLEVTALIKDTQTLSKILLLPFFKLWIWLHLAAVQQLGIFQMPPGHARVLKERAQVILLKKKSSLAI